jgi:hypothetical protein
VRQRGEKFVLHPSGALRGNTSAAFRFEQLLSLRFALLQSFGAFALRQVTCELGESPQSPILIAQRGNSDARPVPRTALANAPAFVDESTGLGSNHELMLGPLAFDRILGIKLAKVLPEDFVRLVARDALRTAIPADHMAVGVQHENRVVGQAFDQQTKAFFALP